MSPVPPKESDKTSQEDNSITNSDIPADIRNNDESEFDMVDDYQEIPQSETGNEINDDDSEDDDDSEEDSDVEIDPDYHLELLASSRSGPSSSKNQVSYDNSHLLEHDIFELRKTLECEDIELDEKKSEKINSLMANFKLPDSAVPEWAKIIPENVWKKNLLDSLNAKKTDLFDLKNEDQ